METKSDNMKVYSGYSGIVAQSIVDEEEEYKYFKYVFCSFYKCKDCPVRFRCYTERDG